MRGIFMNNLINNNNSLIQTDEIENKIYTIRGQQVMFDDDLAMLFKTDVSLLNRQMKRNIFRFPDDFCFQVNSLEFKNLRCQNGISSHGGRRYLPYVYTEHGIIALAGVLKTEVAAKMSVEIARAFIQMRKFILENGDMMLSLAKLQNRQLEFENETNIKFDNILKRIDNLDLPKSALFYEGQWFDAYEFISNLIAKANSEIILIDPYCDDRALQFLKHKNKDCKATICKSSKSKLSEEDISLFEKEYGTVEIHSSDNVHDRYIVLDNTECYSLGTSLNYAGSKLFTINKIEEQNVIKSIINIIE